MYRPKQLLNYSKKITLDSQVLFSKDRIIKKEKETLLAEQEDVVENHEIRKKSKENIKVIDLRDKVDFFSQITLQSNCNKTSRKILKTFFEQKQNSEAKKPYGGGERIKIGTESEKGPHKTIIYSNAKKGVEYIDQQLNIENPIMVGLDYKPNGPNKIPFNSPVDHFVVIVGRNFDPVKDQIFYYYYEVGTRDKEIGTSDDRRLYLQSDFSLTGKKVFGNKTYTVLEIRKN